ncbi:elongation of very long chain fatty acids protein 7 [Trichonephila clavata]|uniref:Elongation of very long chain fatty acids protein n=1 Tax=Trichonephila clavata TaxID=2740835 RepID=A0A8X6KYK3_TRICU|nr:elongation of very long chain fatty acids protein 7 [Trichonephila clavata]
MRNREPFRIKTPMIAYNFILSAFNLYITYRLATVSSTVWHLRCKTSELEYQQFTLKERGGVGWLILFEKFFSLFDTIFFVLRKKYSHISFLHVFHHVCMCLLSAWIINATSPGIFVYVSMTINCFVHVIMYFYYGLAAFGKRMQKYLWWKRYLTVLQILQFVIILSYMAFSFLTGCESFGSIEIASFIFVFALLVLFVNFYRNSFKKKERKL